MNLLSTNYRRLSQSSAVLGLKVLVNERSISDSKQDSMTKLFRKAVDMMGLGDLGCTEIPFT